MTNGTHFRNAYDHLGCRLFNRSARAPVVRMVRLDDLKRSRCSGSSKR
jgi:hypothetical protein